MQTTCQVFILFRPLQESLFCSMLTDQSSPFTKICF